VADKTSQSTSVRESLGGNNVGRNIASDVINVERELITGNGFGIDIQADVLPAVVRDFITGNGYGKDVWGDVLPAVARDVLTGDGYGMTWYGGLALAVREVLMWQPPFGMSSSVREVLLQLPSDPLTPHQQVANYRQAAIMLHPAYPVPNTVKSPQIVPTLRQQIALHANRAWAVSDKFAKTLRHQTAQRRFFSVASQTWGNEIVAKYVEQVALSRNKTYVAVSMDYVRTLRMKVVQHRVTTPASAVKSMITASTLRMQIALSRTAGTGPVITTTADVASHVEQVIQQRAAPTETVIGPDHVAQEVQQVIQRRAAPTETVIGVERTSSYVQQLALRKQYAPPNATADRYAKSFYQTTALRKETGGVNGSFADVPQMRVQYCLGKDYPLPPDVMSPDYGVMVPQFMMQAAQHKETESPHELLNAIYVYDVATQPVVADTFPDKDTIWSEVTVTTLQQKVVVADDSTVFDPTVPQSTVDVFYLSSAPLVADDSVRFDPTVPVSEVTAFTVGQFAALGDVSLPDPYLPTSTLDAQLVGAMPVLGEPFADPLAPTSPVDAFTVAQMLVLVDPLLQRIPARVNRRRPVFSVSIT
jgi:hypothetical protein